jgi:hypothetical protein
VSLSATSECTSWRGEINSVPMDAFCEGETGFGIRPKRAVARLCGDSARPADLVEDKRGCAPLIPRITLFGWSGHPPIHLDSREAAHRSGRSRHRAAYVGGFLRRRCSGLIR